MFVDQVKFKVEGGVGGSGAEAFRRESGVPRGGPSGGDGGDGGSVVLVVDPQLSTLADFRYQAEYRAPRGAHGQGSDKTGRSGEDLVLRVPPGTEVRDAETGESLGEMLEDGERMVVAKGGRGGRGNARFATPTQQAPRRWEPGEEGEERTVQLTLKLLADVGLVGEPNAGKSTLLSTVSAARPRIADYPFTTLTPNLGVVTLPDFRSLVIADIPGIIEGAHEGKGLGHRFLRHIERTRALALLLPLDDPEPQETYERLRHELAEYSPELASRPHCVVFSKADLAPAEDELPGIEAPEAWGTYRVSAATRVGLSELLEGLWKQVDRTRREAASREGQETAVDIDPARKKDPSGQDAPAADPDGEGGSEEEAAWWERTDREL